MRARIQRLWQTRFVREVVTMQLGRFVGIGCGFLTSILYARFLGIGGYGAYAVVLAFVGIAGLATNLGQQPTTLTFLAEAFGRNDRGKMAAILRYYITMCGLTGILLLTFIMIAPAITQWMYGDPAVGRLARFVFVSSLFEFVFSFYAIALQVVREIRLLTILENLKVVVQTALAAALLAAGYGVEGVLTAMLATAALFCLIGLWGYPRLASRHGLPGIRAAAAAGGNLWTYARDGVWIAIDKNVANLYPNLFLFLLSLQAPQSVVGLIRLAFKLADLPFSIALTGAGRLSTSVLSALAAKGGAVMRQAVLRFLKGSIPLQILTTACGIAGVWLFIEPVYGKDFGVAFYPFTVITLLQTFYSVHMVATPILRIHSRIWIATLCNVTGMIAAVALFFGLGRVLPSTHALYAALTVYHLALLAQFVPAWRLLRRSA